MLERRSDLTAQKLENDKLSDELDGEVRETSNLTKSLRSITTNIERVATERALKKKEQKSLAARKRDLTADCVEIQDKIKSSEAALVAMETAFGICTHVQTINVTNAPVEDQVKVELTTLVPGETKGEVTSKEIQLTLRFEEIIPTIWKHILDAGNLDLDGMMADLKIAPTRKKKISGVPVKRSRQSIDF